MVPRADSLRIVVCKVWTSIASSHLLLPLSNVLNCRRERTDLSEDSIEVRGASSSSSRLASSIDIRKVMRLQG